jgi:hypothetical protein
MRSARSRPVTCLTTCFGGDRRPSLERSCTGARSTTDSPLTLMPFRLAGERSRSRFPMGQARIPLGGGGGLITDTSSPSTAALQGPPRTRTSTTSGSAQPSYTAPKCAFGSDRRANRWNAAHCDSDGRIPVGSPASWRSLVELRSTTSSRSSTISYSALGTPSPASGPARSVLDTTQPRPSPGCRPGRARSRPGGGSGPEAPIRYENGGSIRPSAIPASSS